ncbi:MAG TPA: hypothetical protein VG826_33245 [Pirellulales bacterium]|nr:hypothetical protein [Pirellulales bacterium]
MKLESDGMTGSGAWELSRWCGETAELLRELCRDSDRRARNWWNDECDRPEEVENAPRRGEDILSFADRLQTEGYEWAAKAGSLFAEEDGIDATVHVDRFKPADEDDGPFDGEELMTPSPAIALRFDFDAELVELLKTIFHRARCSRSGRGRPFSRTPKAGGWSKKSGCWWVRSNYWVQVRQSLLDNGVRLSGPLANPRNVKDGFFERQQVWHVKHCAWL